MFKGIKHDQELEYKEVWKLQTVIDILRLYGIENTKYQELKSDFINLNLKMTLFFEALTAAGYKRDKNEKLNYLLEYMPTFKSRIFMRRKLWKILQIL